MNKQQCQDLIAGLAHRECLCKCSCPACTHECMSESGQSQVLLGDVLAKIDEETKSFEVPGLFAHFSVRQIIDRVVLLWQPCGFTKSLNEIMKESGFGKQRHYDTTNHDFQDDKKWSEECLKDPYARELFEFLNKIFNDK